MRKKEYQAPSLTVIRMETETIMAASGDVSVRAKDSSDTYDGEFRAKGHTSVWDSWDDDDAE